MISAPFLHYELYGSSATPAVFFLHGFMGTASDWSEIIEQLDRKYHCIAVDLPGHGNSLDLADDEAYTLPGAARCVLQIMEYREITRAAAVGYSMGGRLALYLAIHHGHAFSKLIIESATPGILSQKERTARQALDRKRAQELGQGRLEDFLHTWYQQPLFATLAQDSGKLNELFNKRRLNEPAQLAKALMGMGPGVQAPLWEHLPTVVTPVLLLAGELDSKYVEIMRAMANLLPRAAVAIVPGAGHNVHLENAPAVAKRIEQFLAEA